MRWIRRGQGGQATTEYVGVMVVVAAVVVALLVTNPGVGESVSSNLQAAVCSALNRGCDGIDAPGGGSPGDTDGDGIPDDEDADADGDGVPDDYAPDSDGDGVPDEDDPDSGGPGDGTSPGEFAVQFVEGFAGQLWDEVKGIWDTVKWLWDLVTDPQARRDLALLWDMFKADPIGFGRMLLEGLWAPIQAEIDAGRGGAAVGRTVAMILAAVFGGKGLNKIAHLPEVQRFLRNLDPTGQMDPEELIRRRLGDCVTNSFTPDTGVLMADGSVLPIADVDVGDLVLAADPLTGVAGARPVTDMIVGSGIRELVDVSAGGATLTATEGHPFWLPDTGEWVDAGDLRPGDDLLTAAGAEITVTAVVARTERATVHNLTVAGLHTYYALAGPTAVLVHNADCTPDAPAPRDLFPGGRVPDAPEAEDLIRNSPAVGSALKDDPYHRAPAFVVDDIAERGTAFDLPGGDGVRRVLVQMPGEMNGRSGVFEWIVGPEGLTHQRFIPGGVVNGRPNQRPRRP